MADQTANIIGWSAGVSAVSGAFAGTLASRATTPLSQNPWFILSITIAIVSFAVLLLMGPRLVWTWWRDRPKPVLPPTTADPEPDASLPTVNRAEWEAQCHPAGPDRVVFQLRRLFGDRGAYRDFNAFRCIVTDPGGITTESDGLGIIRQYPPEFSEAPPVHSGRYRSEWKGRASDGRWLDLTSGEREVHVSPFKLNYYTRPEPKYGDWITAHLIGVTNPDGQPERRVRITAERMEPYPKETPPEGAGPSFPYALRPANGGEPEAGLLIKPGQKQSWLIGQTGTGDDGKMGVFGFGNARNGRWELDPDESWRLSCRIRCDGMHDEMPFSIVVDSLDGQTIRVRQEG